MTIGVDIRVLGSPARGGVQEYAERLLAHLVSVDEAITFKLFYSSYRGRAPALPWADGRRVRLYAFRIPNQVFSVGARFLNAPKVDMLMGGVDVFFSPHFFLAPLSGDTKRVTTFHDLSYEYFPEFFSRRQRLWHWFPTRPAWQAKFSDRIIAVSESTKHDLVRTYDIDPAKISVIASGVDRAFSRPLSDVLERFRSEKRLPERFVLFLGTLEPRKNVIGVIRAFNRLKRSGAFGDLDLVIAGAPGWLYQDIFSEAERSPHVGSIRFVGSVSDQERVLYYAAASAFVYPSFFEGFGMPPLEAMACGTPVVVSRTSSLPEVVADAGILVNPYDIAAIAAALSDVLNDQRLRQELIRKGVARAKQFSWERCARETVDILTKP